MDVYEGVVRRIVFHNSDNDFTVLNMETGNDQLTVTGFFPGVYSGLLLRVKGEYKNHSRYGTSFSALQWRAAFPKVQADIVRFLCQMTIRDYWDITPADEDDVINSMTEDEIESLYWDIVDQYHENVYSVIISDSNEIRHVHPDLAIGARFSILPNLLAQNIERVQNLHTIAATLSDIDPRLVQYTSNMITTVNTYYELHETGDVLYYLQNNPYAFCDYMEEYGFGFPEADLIAVYYNLPMDSYERCSAGIRYCYKTKILTAGDVYATPRQLLNAALEILKLQEETLINRIREMIDGGMLVLDTFADVRAVYLREYYEMECFIAEKLTDMYRRNQGNAVIVPDFSEINRTIGLELDDFQKSAISMAINAPIAIITGGPGTGKTTIIRGIIAALHAVGVTSISLAAPTGRAALRMREATGISAQTIHRLLNIVPKSTRNEVEKIGSDVVVIDEVSMIDIDLMDKLVNALEPHVKLILVGDVDQLPSVGPGYVLHDLIESESFDVIRLTQTHRQAEDSSIVKNARRVLRGEMIEMDYRNLYSDFTFERTDNRTQAEEAICCVYQQMYSELADDPDYINSIQVLSPVIDGIAGTRSLNEKIQAMINHREDSFETIDGAVFKTGDRIIVTRNDYDNNVFNGEISVQCAVIESDNRDRKKLRLTFDGNRQVEYEERESKTKWLSLAYAITVHKAQGSEYPFVIMPVFKNGNLYRNLIYTAMTRAKGLLYMVGSLEDMEKGIADVRPVTRNTKLKERIQIGIIFP